MPKPPQLSTAEFLQRKIDYMKFHLPRQRTGEKNITLLGVGGVFETRFPCIVFLGLYVSAPNVQIILSNF